MNGPNRHSIFERIQQDQQSPSLSSALQPNSSFFNNSSLEPDSLEDFDFESAPPAAAAAAAAAVLAPPVNMSTTTHQDEHEPIPHSSGLTGNSNVTSSYATSTTPILQQQQQLAKTTSLTTTEEEELYCLKPIKDDLSQQDTISADQQQRAVLKERPFKNYQLFPGNTRFLCGGRLVTSRDYRAFIAGLIIFITPTVLFGYFV
jgi:palmitoyltransferase ZDHHC9/14/18